jgi:hypothetical protein
MAKGGRSGGYSGGGRSSYGGSSRSYSVAPTPTPYFSRSSTASKTTSTPSSSTVTSSSSSGGFFDSITQGFGFGMGSSMGRNMVDGIMNRPVSSGSSSSTITKEKENMIEKKACDDLLKTFRECMTMNSTDLNVCNQAYKDYNDCMMKKESK